MEITTAELKEVLEYLLEHQKQLGNERFSVPYEYYWNIPKEERYDPYNEVSSTNLTLGQLSWDLEHLQEILKTKGEVTNLHFVWLGQILIALGEALAEKP